MTFRPLEARGPSITLRTALWSWAVTVVTLVVFAAGIIPQQKRMYRENLESKALGLTVSLRDVVAGSVVNEDYSSVVDHCKEILRGDQALDYTVITKNDGFTVISERSGWRSEPAVGQEWRPAVRKPTSGIGFVPLFQRRVFHYSLPFDYSGIEWGWIHVGLSLEGYDRSMANVYQRTLALTLCCILFSLIASTFYARRLVRPILDLRDVVQRVAGGDLAARAEIARHDELGSLGGSVNGMTEALLRRDRILESVRFAAEQFLGAADWNTVIQAVLAKIGEAAEASRAYVCENARNGDGIILKCRRYEWVAPGITSQMRFDGEQCLSYGELGLERWFEGLGRGEIVCGSVEEVSATERVWLQAQNIRSVIVIPVSVEGRWWGYLALDDCHRERPWTEAERHSLRTAADMFGATINRQQTRDALVEAKQTLEARVRERTQELEEQVLAKEKVHAELDEAQRRLIAAARESEEQMKTILNSVRMGIMLVDAETHEIVETNTYANEMLQLPQSQVLGKRCHGFVCPAELGRCPITDLRQQVETSERILLKPDGERLPIIKSAVVINRHGRDYILESFLDISQLKKAEEELRRLHQQLMEASRHAGMAEVATSVLHNVGNVLNSVGVSATIVGDRLRESKVANLRRAAAMLRDQGDNLARFLTGDAKGKVLPEYFSAVGEELAAEHGEMLKELTHLVQNIEHIKKIVSMQQSYAKVSGAVEQVAPTALVEDALRLHAASFEARHIQVTREYAPHLPYLNVDRHKILQILINLLRNAREALDEGSTLNKRLVVSVRSTQPGYVTIRVRDNGVGIASENLTRIFQHGFTTKQNGHGFGLHSGAIAAQEMGGHLTAHSDGPEQGAVFALELPVRQHAPMIPS